MWLRNRTLDRVKKRLSKRVFRASDAPTRLMEISTAWLHWHEPPKDSQWCLRLLADPVSKHSYETVRRVLKKTKSNPGENGWGFHRRATAILAATGARRLSTPIQCQASRWCAWMNAAPTHPRDAQLAPKARDVETSACGVATLGRDVTKLRAQARCGCAFHWIWITLLDE